MGLTPIFSADARLMLTTGVMGGFTTYSTFNYETTNYFREGAWLMGATNIAATLIGCLAAGLAGIAGDGHSALEQERRDAPAAPELRNDDAADLGVLR